MHMKQTVNFNSRIKNTTQKPLASKNLDMPPQKSDYYGRMHFRTPELGKACFV